MLNLSRELYGQFLRGDRFAISVTLTQTVSDFAENDDGSTSEIYRGRVQISSDWINASLPIVAENLFVFMYRAMWLTNGLLVEEGKRLDAAIFQQEPGDAAGPLGLFTI